MTYSHREKSAKLNFPDPKLSLELLDSAIYWT
jgi:phosphoglucomutase